ncbi:THO complex subunit 7 homolog [Planococcus citri]|uniref:THO complex subunit 7 homolog n=1 Tax=Planococcus citri TaxID=170843 RepID=UPI0031F7A451
MGDEEVIKRRLLIDGDGTGDDRRLTFVLKTFVKWCNSDNESPRDDKIIQERLLSQLSQCEYVFEKSRISSKMNETELNNHGKSADEIKKDIEKTKLEIQKAKEDLQKAKIYRKNRIEYEVIANVIDKQPERKEMNEKLVAIKKELTSLEETKQQLDKKLEMRRKHFHVLVASLNQLQALLDYEEKNGESAHINISDDEMDLPEMMEDD